MRHLSMTPGCSGLPTGFRRGIRRSSTNCKLSDLELRTHKADVLATCSKLRGSGLEARGTGVSAAPRVFESFLCRVGLCCLALFTQCCGKAGQAATMPDVVLQVGTKRGFRACRVTKFEQSRAQHPIRSQVPIGRLVVRKLFFRIRCLAKICFGCLEITRHQCETAIQVA